MFDAGQAAAYMQLAAWELGIGSCPASIYEAEKAREILGFPATLHLRIALSFGYPAEENKLSATPKKGGRNRDLRSWSIGIDGRWHDNSMDLTRDLVHYRLSSAGNSHLPMIKSNL